MNCREYQNQIVLFLYEELPEDDRNGLEAHLQQCEGCRQILDEHKGFHSVLSEDTSTWEVPPDLLVESRRSLANELDRLEPKRSWWRIPAFSVVFTPMRMLESATLIAMGLALGVFVSQQQAVPAASSPIAALDTSGTISVIPQNGTVSNLRVVNAEGGRVEFAGDVVQPLRFHGRMDDATTLRLLFSAVQDSANPGSRLQALEVLSRNSGEPSVKEILIQALVNDDNPGVRLKALEGLKPFVAEEGVRAAFMQVLKYDLNSGVRVSAIEALTPFISNDAMVSQIQEVAKDDDNAYVRMKAQGLQFVGNGR